MKMRPSRVLRKLRAGTVGAPDDVNELVDMGYRFINIGSDVVCLSEYCKTIMNRFQQVLAERKKKT